MVEEAPNKTTAETSNIVLDLKGFVQELRQYTQLRADIYQPKGGTSNKKLSQMKIQAEQVRQSLLNKSGRYKQLLIELIGTDKVKLHTKDRVIEQDMWIRALSLKFDHTTIEVLLGCIDSTEQAIGQLESEINKGYRSLAGELIERTGEKIGTLVIVERICSRFSLVSRQLGERHNSRPTIDVNDEYDVQDLLHALLKLHFDDIRPEEWTPSYAGRSSKMDFLLKSEQLVIEVKKTRDDFMDRSAKNF